MAINQYQPTRTGIQGISDALGALSQIYQMKQASQAKDLMEKEGLLRDQQISSGKAQAELLGQQRDIGSDVSKKAQAERGVMLQTLIDHGYLNKDTAGPLLNAVPKTSAYELNNDASFTPILEYMKGEQAARASANRNASRETGNAITTGKDYESTMAPYVQVHNDIKRLDSIFNTKDKNGNVMITPQQLGDANMAVSRLYSPGHQSDSTMSQTEYESAPSRFAEALQKLTANPQDIGSRELVEHIVDQGHHLANVSNQNAVGQLNNLHAGYMAIPDPQVQGVAKAKYGTYSKMFSQQYKTIGSDVPQADPSIPGGHANPPQSSNSNQPPSGINIPHESIQAEMAKRAALKQSASSGKGNASGP